MSVTFCHSCNAVLFEWSRASHQCPPAYSVAEVDGNGEHSARRVHAFSAEDAATEWAERDDADNEYSIVSGSPVTVVVTAPDGTRTRFKVTGESQPTYEAEEIDDDATRGAR